MKRSTLGSMCVGAMVTLLIVLSVAAIDWRGSPGRYVMYAPADRNGIVFLNTATGEFVVCEPRGSTNAWSGVFRVPEEIR